MRINPFIILIIFLIQNTAAIEIKDVYIQVSSSENELNKIRDELKEDKDNLWIYSPDAQELHALSSELEYIRNQLKIMEYRSEDNQELHEKLNEIYLEAIRVESKAKMIFSNINIMKAKKLISLSQTKVNTVNQLTSPFDVNLQGSQASLYEAIRLIEQADNITVIIPLFSSEYILKKQTELAAERIFLAQSSIIEAEKSISNADIVLKKSSVMRNISIIKLRELEENLSTANSSIIILTNEGISTDKVQPLFSEAWQFRTEAVELVTHQKYEEAISKITLSENILHQIIRNIGIIERENKKNHIKNMRLGIFSIFIVGLFSVGVFIWYKRRTPQL